MAIRRERSRTVSDQWRSVVALLLGFVIALSACSAGGDDSADSLDNAIAGDAASDSGGNDTVEMAADDGATDASADSDGAQSESAEPVDPTSPAGAGADTAPISAADLNRQIIFTATVEVDVDDVATSGAEAVAAIEAVGGFVFGQESLGGAEPRSVFTFKVRPVDFDRALAALDGLGELRNQVVSADDVTERVVDLESRIQVAELGVERLRVAMEATTTLDDFAQYERLLLERETELELMRGQIRTLQDQIDLATITLVLTQDRVVNNLEVNVSAYEDHNDGLSCPGQMDRSVESKTDLTVCIELINTGDQALSNLTVVDTGLGIDEATELIAVFGRIDEPLQPGQSVIVAHELVTDRDLRLRTVAGGQPVAIEGGDAAGPPVSRTQNLTISVRPSDDAPGFGDGFESGAMVLAAIWAAVRVTVGFLVPLLVLLPFVVGLGWLLRAWRRRPGRKTRQPAQTASGWTPPPPSPVPPTPAAGDTPAPE